MPPDLVDEGYYRRIERRRGIIGAAVTMRAGRDNEGGSQAAASL